jgi:NTE family protein
MMKVQIMASIVSGEKLILQRINKMKKNSRLLHTGMISFMLFILSACAHYSFDDKPLSEYSPDDAKAFAHTFEADRSPEVLVMVAFSGGGTRAASFAYGALQELADTEMMTAGGPRSLLNEIDMISSVSGGSFTSAYYGLYGDKIFEDFEARFLRQNVQGRLLWKLVNPIIWFKLASSTYGKADMAAEYYDKILFNGATFADMFRPGAPVVNINSTDLASGNRFPFSMPFFYLICNDLRQYPVSRAVTASSAVPGLFSPIALENFAGSCGFEIPAWAVEALKDETDSIRKTEAENLLEFMVRQKRPWLHLVDGGVSDNLGLRSFAKLFVLGKDLQDTLKFIGHARVRQILIISVDSHTKYEKEWASKRREPSLLDILGSVTDIQIDRFSEDSKVLVKYAFEQWAKELSTNAHPVSFHFVDVSFEEVKNDDDRNRLYKIGTNFHLHDDEVDLLIASARKVLRESAEFKNFLEEYKNRNRP